MRIFLIRHGQSLGNVDSRIHKTMADHAIPLSSRGEEQAHAAGDVLDSLFTQRYGVFEEIEYRLPHIRLWTSPYKRTRETADALQASKAGRWIRDRREHVLLCEQQFGLFDGIPDEQLPIRFPNEHAHYQKHVEFEGKFWARMPLGESRFDVAIRVHQAFGTFQRDAMSHGIEELIVVCHGVTMRAFIMMWCHLTPEWFEDEPNPHNCSIRLIDAGGYEGVVFEGFRQ